MDLRALFFFVMEKRNRVPRNYWNEQTLAEEALKYEGRSEFMRKSSGAYSTAARAGLLDKICNHMTPQGNLNKRFLYKVSFDDGAVYIGLSWNPTKRFTEGHLVSESSSVYKHMVSTGLNPSLELMSDILYSAEDAAELEDIIIEEYKNLGRKVLNKAKGGALGGNKGWWNIEMIMEYALQCSSKPEFRSRFSKAYEAAKRLGFMDKVCEHMKIVKRSNNYWTEERILEECVKYKTKSELLAKSHGTYKAARRLRLVDKMYELMGLLPKDDRSHLYEKGNIPYNKK